MLPIQIIVRKPHQIAIILIHFILLRAKGLNLELHPIKHHPVTQGRLKSPLCSHPSFYAKSCINPCIHTHQIAHMQSISAKDVFIRSKFTAAGLHIGGNLRTGWCRQLFTSFYSSGSKFRRYDISLKDI